MLFVIFLLVHALIISHQWREVPFKSFCNANLNFEIFIVILTKSGHTKHCSRTGQPHGNGPEALSF